MDSGHNQVALSFKCLSAQLAENPVQVDFLPIINILAENVTEIALVDGIEKECRKAHGW